MGVLLFLFVFFFVSLCIVGLVLLQEGKGGGLTGMSTGMDGIMGARNPLRRWTAYLFILFVFLCLAFNLHLHRRSRMDDSLPTGIEIPRPATTLPDGLTLPEGSLRPTEESPLSLPLPLDGEEVEGMEQDAGVAAESNDSVDADAEGTVQPEPPAEQDSEEPVQEVAEVETTGAVEAVAEADVEEPAAQADAGSAPGQDVTEEPARAESADESPTPAETPSEAVDDAGGEAPAGTAVPLADTAAGGDAQ